MKNRKKGFTLIELLAVIVILAVIMVIAVPKILNIIENSKKNAFESSYMLIGDAIKTQIVSSTLTEGNKFAKDGECYIFELPDKNENAKNLKVKNKEQFTGTIKYCNGKLEYENVTNGPYIVNTIDGKNKVSKVDGENKDDEVVDNNYLVKVIIRNWYDGEESYINGPIKKNEIESIKFEKSNIVPSDAIGQWDVSNEGNGSVMAWYKDEDNDSLYELYIGQNGGVKANPDSSYLFMYLTNVTSLDLSNLNTSNVTNMSKMFFGCESLTSLDLSSFDTSNVTNMSEMFREMEKLMNLDLSNFNTSSVTDMQFLFAECYVLTNIDLSSFDTSKVKSMRNMFRNDSKVRTTITISNPDMTMNGIEYGNDTWMFLNAITDSSAKVIINYTSETESLVDEIISICKSTNSNVVKGELVQ